MSTRLWPNKPLVPTVRRASLRSGRRPAAHWQVVRRTEPEVSSKGTSVWDRFIKLNKLRDRVIHLKWNDVRKSAPENDTIWRELLLLLHRDLFCTCRAAG